MVETPVERVDAVTTRPNQVLLPRPMHHECTLDAVVVATIDALKQDGRVSCQSQQQQQQQLQEQTCASVRNKCPLLCACHNERNTRTDWPLFTSTVSIENTRSYSSGVLHLKANDHTCELSWWRGWDDVAAKRDERTMMKRRWKGGSNSRWWCCGGLRSRSVARQRWRCRWRASNHFAPSAPSTYSHCTSSAASILHKQNNAIYYTPKSRHNDVTHLFDLFGQRFDAFVGECRLGLFVAWLLVVRLVQLALSLQRLAMVLVICFHRLKQVKPMNYMTLTKVALIWGTHALQFGQNLHQFLVIRNWDFLALKTTRKYSEYSNQEAKGRLPAN